MLGKWALRWIGCFILYSPKPTRQGTAEPLPSRNVGLHSAVAFWTGVECAGEVGDVQRRQSCLSLLVAQTRLSSMLRDQTAIDEYKWDGGGC